VKSVANRRWRCSKKKQSPVQVIHIITIDTSPIPSFSRSARSRPVCTHLPPMSLASAPYPETTSPARSALLTFIRAAKRSPVHRKPLQSSVVCLSRQCPADRRIAPELMTPATVTRRWWSRRTSEA